jgi:zinc/manganese transport system substrate-binding protein
MRSIFSPLATFLCLTAWALLFGACQPEPAPEEIRMLTLPAMEAVPLDGRPLAVVATTGIIGDMAAQIGGQAIELKVLMGPGVDPHSFIPAPGDLAAMHDADLVLVNGWDLEESLRKDLENIADRTEIAPVSAGIVPRPAGEHLDGAGQADPHVWMDVENVMTWAANIEATFKTLDPANQLLYAQNSQRYRLELADLEAYAQEKFGALPPEKRILVTNHDSLAYLAQAYNFEILGTILPAASTLAEPSAADLADLVEAMQDSGVCTIFTETSANETLARTVAAELDGCNQVTVLPLYTGNLGPAGSGAESYLGMMRHNIDAIVAGLQ